MSWRHQCRVPSAEHTNLSLVDRDGLGEVVHLDERVAHVAERAELRLVVLHHLRDGCKEMREFTGVPIWALSGCKLVKKTKSNLVGTMI